MLRIIVCLALLLCPSGASAQGNDGNLWIPSAISADGQLTYGTIAAGDATPSVGGAIVWTTSANVAPTAVTDLDNVSPRQWVVLVGGSNTNPSTIADSGNFALDNKYGAMTLSLDAWIAFYVQADNDYLEIGRGDNASADAFAPASIFMADDLPLAFGNSAAAPDCALRWDTTGTDHMALWCTDIDGAGTDGDVCYVDTGTRVWHCLGGLTIAGTLTGASGVDATTESTIEAAVDTLANLTSVQSQTVSLSGALTVEAGGCTCNQDLTTDASPSFTAETLGSATADCGAFTLIKGAQVGDPQLQVSLSADGVGAATIATSGGTNGDITLSPSGGEVHVGADDSAKNVEIHSGGTFKMWDASDDTSVTLDVDNGTTELDLTGDLSVSSDLDVVDTMTCGDAVIDENAGVLAFTGATSAGITTVAPKLDLPTVDMQGNDIRNPDDILHDAAATDALPRVSAITTQASMHKINATNNDGANGCIIPASGNNDLTGVTKAGTAGDTLTFKYTLASTCATASVVITEGDGTAGTYECDGAADDNTCVANLIAAVEANATLGPLTAAVARVGETTMWFFEGDAVWLSVTASDGVNTVISRGTDGMLSIPSGTAALPGLTYSDDPDTGLVHAAANTISLNTNAGYRLSCTATTCTMGAGLSGDGYSLDAFLNKTVTFGSSSVLGATRCMEIILESANNVIHTLPDAVSTNAGCVFRLVNTAADGTALVGFSPHSSDGIDGTCGAVNFNGTVDHDVVNTLLTQQKGDSLTIVSDGATGWFVFGCTGVWASL